MPRTASTEASPDVEDFCGGLGVQLEDSSRVEGLALGLGLGLGRLGKQLQGKNNSIGRVSAQEEASWRRHMSLELQPLVPPTLGRCPERSTTDRSLGKSLSVQDLIQASPAPIQDAYHSLSSPSPSTSSESHSCGQDPGGGGGGVGGGKGRRGLGRWGEEDLFISDREMETKGFDFLSLETPEAQTFSSELLRTGGGVGTGAGPQVGPAGLARGYVSATPSPGSNELLNTPHVRLK